MKTVSKYLVVLVGGFLLLVYIVHGGLSKADFNAAFIGILSDHSLSSIPVTFKGALDVEPKGGKTKDLYTALMQLAQKYNMRTNGDGANDGVQWQIQIHCEGNFVGGASTAGYGELVMFDSTIYGFKNEQDYKDFNEKMVDLMRQYGNVRDLKNYAPLTHADLLARGVYMKRDVTSQCAP